MSKTVVTEQAKRQKTHKKLENVTESSEKNQAQVRIKPGYQN